MMIVAKTFIALGCALVVLSLQGCAGVLLGSAATSAAVVNDARTTGTVVEDQSIEVKALGALRKDSEIRKQAHYSVTSYNQIVLLTGQAPSEEMRDRIAEIVAGVEKIRHIHNEITIAAPSSMLARTNDTVLTTKVKTRLFAHENLKATRVKVVSEAGTVFLLGLVSSEDARLAANVASTTSGVQKVVKLFELQQ